MMQYGVAQTPALGEMVCGDSYVVCDDGDVTLLAVADGLGHGEHAAVAAEAFREYVRENSAADLTELIVGAGRHLAGTRGVAAAMVRIDRAKRTLEFIGIGNIAFQSIGPDHVRPVSLPGIIGQPLRKVRPFLYDVNAEIIFSMCSDGISTRFDLADYAKMQADEAAASILETHSKGYDDATCLIMHFHPEA